jgi:hypothetical protein
MPQALVRSSGTTVIGPQSTPASVPQTTAPPAFAVQVPQVVQTVLDQAAPLLKPTLEAANSIAQAITPLAIPKSNASLAEPVATERPAEVANNVPIPVAPSTYPSSIAALPSPPMEEMSAGTARRLVNVQQQRSGAFTFMKPLFDGDGVYFTGHKQVRTIPAPPPKPEPKPKEDPITERMRYLQKGGALRNGESFMFSEENGEGTLILPDGTVERRKLQGGEDHDKLMRNRRPDIMGPKDLQYTLSLLGKLLPAQQQQQGNGANGQDQMNGPTLEQLMNQMNQQSKGFFGWMKKSLNINN